MIHKVLVIDNRDSFTFNLVHYLEDLGCEVDVLRSDLLELEHPTGYDAVVISPGPGLPSDWPRMMRVLENSATVPCLGVCLGMQAMSLVCGGSLKQLDHIRHGIQRPIDIVEDSILFKGLSSQLEVGLYHSWAVNAPDDFTVVARDKMGEVMAMQHNSRPWYAVQFHPESIMTTDGMTVLRNFLSL